MAESTSDAKCFCWQTLSDQNVEAAMSLPTQSVVKFVVLCFNVLRNIYICNMLGFFVSLETSKRQNGYADCPSICVMEYGTKW